MGLFGASKGGGGFDWGAAALSLFSPEAAAGMNRRRAGMAQAEEEARQRSVVQQAAEQMGIPKNVINTLRTEELSRLVLERSQPRQFDSGGGSRFDPLTGQWTLAPSERTIGPDIIRTDSAGQSRPVYQGIDPVAVPPGGGLYGVTGSGEARELIAPAGAPPQIGAQPPPSGAGPTPGAVVNGYRFRGGNPNDPNAWEPVGQGGAGPSGPRNFR